MGMGTQYVQAFQGPISETGLEETYFLLCQEGGDQEGEALNAAARSAEGGLTMEAKQTSECGSITSPTQLLSLKRTEGTFYPGLSTRSDGGRREKAGEPNLETKRKVSSGGSAGGHGVEICRMTGGIGAYAGDRAGAMLEVQIRQVVGIQQVYPAISNPSFTGSTLFGSYKCSR